ncbi:hypothetical protein Tco_0811226 [Tanacetum coccineum]
MIKVSSSIGMWTTFSSQMILTWYLDNQSITMTMSKLQKLIGIRSILKVVSNVIDGILSIEARDIDTKLLSAPESNNTLAKSWFRRNVPIASSGWPFVSAVSGQMTHLVASLTLDSASISPEGFRPSILLLAVIIVAVAIAIVVAFIVVVAVIGVVVVVVVPSIIKLLFVITSFLHRTTLYYLIHQSLGYVSSFF